MSTRENVQLPCLCTTPPCVLILFVSLPFVLHLATPIIATHPSSVVSKEGDRNVSLHCSAQDYGLGHILYKWEKYHSSNSSWMEPSNRAKSIVMSDTLKFNAITEEDEGVYRCVVSNHDGSAVSENATLTVYGKLIIN